METNPLKSWIIEHDDKWLFVILYIGLAVVLSIWISLFWLVAVVGVHFGLEIYRQRQLHRGFQRVIAEALWELRLDIALILFALALALYMDIILGIVGLGSAARLWILSRTGVRIGMRTGVRALPRIAGWERAMRGFLLSVDDLAQVARAFVRGGNPPSRPGTSSVAVKPLNNPIPEAPVKQVHPIASPIGSWTRPWGTGDRLAIGFFVLCLVLIAISPWLTEHTPATALATLAEELQPFPFIP